MKRIIIAIVKKAKNNNTMLWNMICLISKMLFNRTQGNVSCENCLMFKSTIKAGNKSNQIMLRGGIFRKCRIIIDGTNSSVIIDKGCRINCTDIILYGDNVHCVIGENVTFNSFTSAESGINLGSGTSLEIGEGSLFSNSIGIYTTDFHKIYDSTGKQVNNNASIKIGKNVWVGMKAVVLKGSMIPDGCVIGANTIVSGKIKEENCVCVGNTSNIIKRNIRWEK